MQLTDLKGEYVWSLLRTTPPSETRSGARTGRNCLALIVPCHRVIRADGNLCGYGGGVWRKQWVLEHERRVITQAA